MADSRIKYAAVLAPCVFLVGTYFTSHLFSSNSRLGSILHKISKYEKKVLNFMIFFTKKYLNPIKYIFPVSEYHFSNFDDACNFVRKNSHLFSNIQLLELYGLYKQALNGDCDANNSDFGMFSLDKVNAWKKHEGLSKNVAEVKYTVYVNKVLKRAGDSQNNTKAENQKSGSNLTKSVSTTKKTSDVTKIASSHFKVTEFNRLIDAISDENLGLCVELLNENPNLVNISTPELLTPMHFCADVGNTAILKLMLSYCPNINAQDNGKDTPLHCAIYRNNEQIVDVLLSAKPDVALQNHENYTPLDCALQMGCSPNIIDKLQTSSQNCI